MDFLKLVIFFGAARAASFSHTDPRIVGGVNATILEVPWQATIHYYPVNICGGAIINKDTILSATHCFVKYGTDPVSYHVRVGNTKRSVGGEVYNVKKVVIHPDFDVENYNADIAIVKLASDITFSDRVKVVPLPDLNEYLPVGKFGIVTGWGQLKHNNGAFPIALQKVYLPIVDQELCRKVYDGMRNITENMFCAGTFDGKVDACNGDSGGPFVVNNKLYGIVSWGIECAVPQYPGVFTSVAPLRSWIDENMN